MHGSHAGARWVLLIAFTAALSLVAGPAEAGRKASRASSPGVAPAEFFGINGGGVWDLAPGRRAALLAAFRSHGLSVVRMDVSWAAIEPEPPSAGGARSFRWDAVDARVAEAAAAGLRIHPLLAYSTTWSGVTPGDVMSRPADPALFAGWAAAVARRYGRGGDFWAAHPELARRPFAAYEVWNEPNVSRFWREQQSAPEDYADLYALTRSALRGVDPRAEVVAGGLVERGAIPFLGRMLGHRPGLARELDAVAYHPYMDSPAGMVWRLRDLRRALDAAGARRATIALTEVGWSTSHVSDARRGRRMVELTRRVLRPRLRVTRLIPYAAITPEADPADWEQWLGLYEPHGEAKPAMRTWAAAIARVARA